MPISCHHRNIGSSVLVKKNPLAGHFCLRPLAIGKWPLVLPADSTAVSITSRIIQRSLCKKKRKACLVKYAEDPPMVNGTCKIRE